MKRLMKFTGLTIVAIATLQAPLVMADPVPFTGIGLMLDESSSMIANMPDPMNSYGSVRAVRWSTTGSYPDSGPVPAAVPNNSYYHNANCAAYTSMFITAALHNFGYVQRQTLPDAGGPLMPNDSVFIKTLSETVEEAITGVSGQGGYGPKPGDYYTYFARGDRVPVNQQAGAPLAGFQSIPTVQAISAGDFIAIKNVTECDDSVNQIDCSGHMATVVSAPVALPSRTGRTYFNSVVCDEYKVRIIDSTSSPHGDHQIRASQGDTLDDRDTRVNADGSSIEGLGAGTMILCAAPETGELVGYRWSFKSSDTYSNVAGTHYTNDKAVRLIMAGRLEIDE
jgi:hypothetical protein